MNYDPVTAHLAKQTGDKVIGKNVQKRLMAKAHYRSANEANRQFNVAVDNRQVRRAYAREMAKRSA